MTHERLERVILGSVTTEVIRDGRCSVLVIPPGVGGRTYDYADHLAKNTRCIAAYGSVGAEIQRKVITLRAEARDYLSCYESPISTERRSRNDLGLTVGLAFHRR